MATALRSVPPKATATLHVLADPGRLRALEDCGLLDEPTPTIERLAHVLADVTRAKFALVSIVDNDEERFISSSGVPEPWLQEGALAIEQSFAKWIVSSGHPLIIEDARLDSLLADREPVLGWGVVSYAGHPIRAASGHVIGAVALMDVRPRRWAMGELNLLRETALSITTELRARATKHALIAKAAVLDAMMTALGDDVDVYDASGRVLSSNRQARASARAQTVVPLCRDARFAESATATPVSPQETPIARALRGERSNAEWFVRDADFPAGHWRRISATPVIDGRARVIGAVVVSSDSRSGSVSRLIPVR